MQVVPGSIQLISISFFLFQYPVSESRRAHSSIPRVGLVPRISSAVRWAGTRPHPSPVGPGLFGASPSLHVSSQTNVFRNTDIGPAHFGHKEIDGLLVPLGKAYTLLTDHLITG